MLITFIFSNFGIVYIGTGVTNVKTTIQSMFKGVYSTNSEGNRDINTTPKQH
jgi:hypothetical protein